MYAIREPVPDDLAAIQALHQACNRPVADSAKDNIAGLRLLAEKDDELVGFLLCGRHGQVRQLVIHPQANALEVTKVLVDKALMKLRRLDVGKLKLVGTLQDAAAPLWPATQWQDMLHVDDPKPMSVTETAAEETAEVMEEVEVSPDSIEDEAATVGAVTVEAATIEAEPAEETEASIVTDDAEDDVVEEDISSTAA